MPLVDHFDGAAHERVICTVVVEYSRRGEAMPKGTAMLEVAGIVRCSVSSSERYGVNGIILVGPDDGRSLFHRDDRRVKRIGTDHDCLCRMVGRHSVCFDALACHDGQDADRQEHRYLAHDARR